MRLGLELGSGLGLLCAIDEIAWNPAGIRRGRLGQDLWKCVQGPHVGHTVACFKAQSDSE